MMIAKVIGTVVATVKHPSYNGRKVLIVQPLDLEGIASQGSSFLAVDSVQAGVGDKVLVTREGGTARMVNQAGEEPIHSAVVAIVDNVQIA